MKIAQYFDNGRIRLGIVQENALSPIDFDGDMIDFIQQRPEVKPSGNSIAIDQAKLAAPVTRPTKIIALGLNYRDHAAEGKAQVPEAPLIFAKFPNSLIGSGQVISWNRNITDKVDYEAELAVIIGNKTCGDIPEAQAMEAVFGYTCANDISARDLQFGDKQWVRGKSLDTFCPLGPWIVTREEIADPHKLNIRCHINGRTLQDSHTGEMFFKIPFLVSFLSRHFTLMPGDLILTGTPSGVGVFRTPRIYLKDGDEVVVEIKGIGRLVNSCETFEK
jgi:2-keto-4-pentenoate hydratase/2-oxohepta-3-ene-1,7-dioic acid hydratase in catechol pathway